MKVVTSLLLLSLLLSLLFYFSKGGIFPGFLGRANANRTVLTTWSCKPCSDSTPGPCRVAAVSSFCSGRIKPLTYTRGRVTTYLPSLHASDSARLVGHLSGFSKTTLLMMISGNYNNHRQTDQPTNIVAYKITLSRLKTVSRACSECHE